MKTKKIVPAMAAMLTFAFYMNASAESYEDYMPARGQNLQGAQIAAGSDVYDELRKSIRNEINGTNNPENETYSDSAVSSALNKEIRRIAKEETEKAVQSEGKYYPYSGAFEIGGFIYGMTTSKKDQNGDKQSSLRFMGVMNYFLSGNMALSLKGDGDFDITNNHQLYGVELGPMFAFALDSRKLVSLYVAIYGGVTFNNLSYLHDKYGIRYANEAGFKFSVAKGVNINLGIMAAFDNEKAKASGFETVITPMLGITAWL
jgi:hypothetical protein